MENMDYQTRRAGARLALLAVASIAAGVLAGRGNELSDKVSNLMPSVTESIRAMTGPGYEIVPAGNRKYFVLSGRSDVAYPVVEAKISEKCRTVSECVAQELGPAFDYELVDVASEFNQASGINLGLLHIGQKVFIPGKPVPKHFMYSNNN